MALFEDKKKRALSDSDQPDAGERLLNAAEKLFLEKGFNQTSVRDITKAAHCNVAAVNYHYGGKEKLYVEMFKRQVSLMIAEHLERINELMSQPAPTLEQLVRCMAEPCLRSLEKNEPRTAVIRLMIREILNQTVNPVDLAGDLKESFLGEFRRALMKVVPELDDRSATLLVFSLDALMVHPVLFIPFYMDWIPDLTIDQILDHIVRFSTAAIQGYIKT